MVVPSCLHLRWPQPFLGRAGAAGRLVLTCQWAGLEFLSEVASALVWSCPLLTAAMTTKQQLFFNDEMVAWRQQIEMERRSAARAKEPGFKDQPKMRMSMSGALVLDRSRGNDELPALGRIQTMPTLETEALGKNQSGSSGGGTSPPVAAARAAAGVACGSSPTRPLRFSPGGAPRRRAGQLQRSYSLPLSGNHSAPGRSPVAAGFCTASRCFSFTRRPTQRTFCCLPHTPVSGWHPFAIVSSAGSLAELVRWTARS